MAKQCAFGSDGDLTFISGHHAVFEAWALTVSQNLVEESGWGDTWEVTKADGLKRGRFSATGFPEYGSASTTPGIGAITAAGGIATFQVAPGCTFAATCVVTTAGISSNNVGQARVSYAGATSGEVTPVWAVS